MKTKKRVAIFFSGRGSNMKTLIEAAQQPSYPAEIVCALCSRENAEGIGMAKDRGVQTHVIPRKKFSCMEEHEQAVEACLDECGIDLIALAGYMLLLSKEFIERRSGKILNIHPALLPSFKGLNTHARALEAGVRIHGCTTHFVTHGMDEGPIIAQAAVPVLLFDTCATLAQRVLSMEHEIYPLSLKWVAEEKAVMEDKKTVFKKCTESDIPSWFFHGDKTWQSTKFPE